LGTPALLHLSQNGALELTHREELEAARRAYEAEAIARYCLRTLFVRQQLWRRFKEDGALVAFWSLDDSERRDLWGDPLDWELVASRFDSKRATMQLGS